MHTVHPHTCKHTYKHTKVIFKNGGYMTKYFKVGIIKLVFIEGFIYPLQSFKLNHIEIHITTRFKYYHSSYFKLGTYLLSWHLEAEALSSRLAWAT